MRRRLFIVLFFVFFALWFLSSFVSFSYAGTLVYSTYLGGGSGDNIAVDGSGNAYITGVTDSSDFPTTPSAFDTSYNGGYDVFVSKLNASGTALVYSTYLGGSGDDEGTGIAIDGSGNAYITGETYSTDFPTTSGAFDTSYNGGYDVFVSKLNASGTALVYSTYLGGSGDDEGTGIAVDGSGTAYITGSTSYSTDFPTTAGAYDRTYNRDTDVFVTKLNASGTALVYSTYLGGSGWDEGTGIAIDGSGNTYITGVTNSTDFPTTPGAFDTSYNGYWDGFVTKLNASGTALVYSTYLGGSGWDEGTGIAIDGSGNTYITGFTDYLDFPTTPGAFDTLWDWRWDGFVTKLNASGTALVYSTFLGGGNDDITNGIAVDSSGNTYITGRTKSDDFPTTPGAFETSFNGDWDVFMTKLNPSGTALVYSTYLGGGGWDEGHGIAVDSSGNVYITGETWSSNFPITSGAFDTSFNGNWDVFVSKISAISVSAPISRFYGIPTTGFVPLNVQFYDTSLGNPTDWYWTFGDGSTSTERNPAHTYTNLGKYTVTLSVSNVYGVNTATKSNYITVLTPLPPQARFYGIPTSGFAPLRVQFYDISDGNPAYWYWTFGDGSISNEQHPVHIYAHPGLYTVILVVLNDYGADTITKANYILVYPAFPPIVDFYGNPTTGVVPLLVEFHNTTYGYSTSWLWEFGDGNISTERNPTHTYYKYGIYSVRLFAGNKFGINTAIKINYIFVLPRPEANFYSDTSSGYVPLSVHFYDSSIGAPTDFNWNFGDGYTSTEKNPIHTYLNAGHYTVQLIAANAFSVSTNIKYNFISVYRFSGADFYSIPSSGFAPLAVQFFDVSYSNPTSWFWDFGDGGTSTIQNPTYTYSTAGLYTVRLVVSNSNGVSTAEKVDCVRVLPALPSPLLYSTFLGEWGGLELLAYEAGGIVLDSGGNAYITSATNSPNFPTTLGAYDTTLDGIDVFVSKLNADGSALIYSTFIGVGLSGNITVDNFGNAYITGRTDSPDFLTTLNAFDTTFNGGCDVFVTKLNPAGTELIYSTFLGGSRNEIGYGITVDTGGNAYVTGFTSSSSDFPITAGAYQTTFNGGTWDAFVTKLNASGSALAYSTYLGGRNDDGADDIALDSDGNAYLTGPTGSPDYPTTPGVFDDSSNGGSDAFVTKLNANGSALLYSTYMGGSNTGESSGIAIDSSGCAYTNSGGFVAKLNPTGSALIFSTSLGGPGNDIAVDNLGNVYVTGDTYSANFLTTPGAFQTRNGGGYDAFLSKLNADGSRLLYSTYLGGGGYDKGFKLALDTAAHPYIMGYTESSDFPTTANAFDTTISGGGIFVSKLVLKTLITDFYDLQATPSSSTVQFFDKSYGTPTSWYWPFGDGTFSTEQNPTHTYSTTGVYTVSLIAQNAYEMSTATKNNYVVVSVPTSAVTNIPDVKLFKGQTQTDLLRLNGYLLNTTQANWRWSSQSTLANLSIDSDSWVDYLEPWLPIAGLDTVIYTAEGVGSDTSLLKYSTYLWKRFPDALVNNGRKLLNGDINLQNYLSIDTGLGYPSGYPYEVRYSDSSDSGKLSITFSGNSMQINPSSALSAPAEIIITATPDSTSDDWDKEIVHVSEVLDTYGLFTTISDTWHYWFELPLFGATQLPTASWVTGFAGRNGLLAFTCSTASEGVKLVYNQELDIQPYTWYCLRGAFASDAGAGNRHQVSGTLFLVDTVNNITESGTFLQQPGLLSNSTWWTQYAYVYNDNSTVKKVRPMLVIKNNGSPGNVYLDSMLVYENKPMTERAYGRLAKIEVPNGSFDFGTSGWFYGYPVMGIDRSAPMPGYTIVSSFGGQNAVLQLGFSQVSQGIKFTSNPLINITPMKSLMLSWKAYGAVANSGRLLQGQIYCVDTVGGGNRSDVLGPSGVVVGMPNNQWVTYTAVGTPLLNTETQARMQLVVKNSNVAYDVVYLDDITLEQESDSPYYWDHSLF